MKILLHPTYFPNIQHWVAMLNAETVVFETCDNYQKQTYRNRALIYAANGMMSLNIPVHYTQNNRQLYKDVRIANISKWQANHWKSLLSAYSTSPFFEFYKDDLRPLFETKFDFLLDFNFTCFTTILECLQIELEYQLTEIFEKEPTGNDFRYLVNKTKDQPQLDTYTQVFSNKHGFIPNLSILDLLFNEGPNTIAYLKSQILN